MCKAYMGKNPIQRCVLLIWFIFKGMILTRLVNQSYICDYVTLNNTRCLGPAVRSGSRPSPRIPLPASYVECCLREGDPVGPGIILGVGGGGGGGGGGHLGCPRSPNAGPSYGRPRIPSPGPYCTWGRVTPGGAVIVRCVPPPSYIGRKPPQSRGKANNPCSLSFPHYCGVIFSQKVPSMF